MMNKEKYKRTFDTLASSERFSLEVTEMKKEIHNLLNLDKEKVSRECRQYAEKHYSIEAMISEYYNLYKTVETNTINN